MAQRLGTSQQEVSSVIRTDLDLSLIGKQKVHHLTPAAIA